MIKNLYRRRITKWFFLTLGRRPGNFYIEKKRSFIEMNVSSVGTEKIFIEMCAN
jgi:hypothetical protein